MDFIAQQQYKDDLTEITDGIREKNYPRTEAGLEEWKRDVDQIKTLAPQMKALGTDDQRSLIRYNDQGIVTDLWNSAPVVAGRSNESVKEAHQYLKNINGYMSKYGCFTEGTRISTPNGDVAIEELKAGDMVNTLSGPQPLKWIGFRSLTDMERWSSDEKANNYPVHILAGALGDGIPARDISVSAWHHVYVKNVLVRAKDLINGSTIYQEEEINAVKYFHLELEEFDVILAHGLYSESYTDNGVNRGFYDNAVTAIRPQLAQNGGIAPRSGFTVARPGKNAELLEAIKQFTDARAEQLQAEEALSA